MRPRAHEHGRWYSAGLFADLYVAGNVVGYEAFSRFATEPVRPPERWFGEATRVGLGPELQALAIERILASATRADLPDQAFLSLNVSPRYLAHPSVEAALTGADPSLLVVELTEEEAVHDYGALRRAMAPHVERGVRWGTLPKIERRQLVDAIGAE